MHRHLKSVTKTIKPDALHDWIVNTFYSQSFAPCIKDNFAKARSNVLISFQSCAITFECFSLRRQVLSFLCFLHFLHVHFRSLAAKENSGYKKQKMKTKTNLAACTTLYKGVNYDSVCVRSRHAPFRLFELRVAFSILSFSPTMPLALHKKFKGDSCLVVFLQLNRNDRSFVCF